MYLVVQALAHLTGVPSQPTQSIRSVAARDHLAVNSESILPDVGDSRSYGDIIRVPSASGAQTQGGGPGKPQRRKWKLGQGMQNTYPYRRTLPGGGRFVVRTEDDVR